MPAESNPTISMIFLIVSISAMLTNVLLLMQNISRIFHFLLNYFKGKWL